MADKQQFEVLLDNPNIRKALDIIAASEHADYNTTFGGGKFDDYSEHPNIKKSFKQKDGKINSSGAAGRYQFLKSTWDEIKSTYGLDDFSPRNQDIGALVLLNRMKGSDGKTALQSAMEGDFQGMVEKSGRTWASFPSAPAKYSQPKHGWNKMNKIIASAVGATLPHDDVAQYHDQQAQQTTDESEYSAGQNRYNTGIRNPVDGVVDDGYQQLQSELFSVGDDQRPDRPQQQGNVKPSPQVASVQQEGFIDIPELYNKAIENAFGDGNSNDMFSQEINDALRGVFDVS